MKIGYSFLKDLFKLAVFEPKIAAELSTSVSRIVTRDNTMLIPRVVAPSSDKPMDHVLFALKHEGINLQVLSEVLPKIDAIEIKQKFIEAPNGEYIRKAAYLWEKFNHQELEGLPEIKVSNYVDMFDSKKYITGQREKDSKFRVYFNGIGSLDYCPVIERTKYIDESIEKNVLGRTKQFIEDIGKANADRALGWAYLSETESSYAIEGEHPNSTKAERFMGLLKRAHDRQELTEGYLTELQNQVVTNPFNKDVAFRSTQNWLGRGGVRGSAAVTYVPPAPELLRELMPRFMEMANTAPMHLDPVVAASVTSFAFVYLHPFMDGNGRLSRFLFHQELCKSGELEKGLLLPVSVAMQASERAYLETLESFSVPARNLWSVTWLDQSNYDFKFEGSESIYRYWNATDHTEFGFEMADNALNIHLRKEVDYLKRYDKIYKAVNDNYDVSHKVLDVLVNGSIRQGGIVSKNLRKKFIYEVQPEAIDYLENVAQEVMSEPLAKQHVVVMPSLAQVRAEKDKENKLDNNQEITNDGNLDLEL